MLRTAALYVDFYRAVARSTNGPAAEFVRVTAAE
jgi:hypothetical protein